jgi:hypothetical protein
MKYSKLFSVTILVLTTFTFSKCKKDKDEPQLPPETTTGAMTFRCKVNGQVFVPRDGNGHPGLNVQYVNLGNGPGGGYLNMPATNWVPNPRKGLILEQIAC